MTTLILSKRVFFLVLIVVFVSCNSRDNQQSQENWISYLSALPTIENSEDQQSDVHKLFDDFQRKYRWQSFYLLNYQEFANWVNSGTREPLADSLLSKHQKALGDFVVVFREKIKNSASPASLEQKLKLIEDMVRFGQNINSFEAIDFNSLQAAILDIQSKFHEEYNGTLFLNQLDETKEKYGNVKTQLINKTAFCNEALAGFIASWESLKKEALLANPLLTHHPVVFVTRQQYTPDHHNTATLFQTNEINTNSFTPGGSLKIVDFKNGGKVKTLLKSEEGVIRDPEISYDGEKILFSMRNNIDEDYHIYEVDSDGKNLKQLTKAEGVADVDPQYLPDGNIVFSSTREPKYCMCNVHIMCNLFRMEGDGANITQLGKSSLFEGHSSVMPDGHILYDRWEYVDRNFGDAQGLWTMNPDGTNQAVYYGNNTNSPGGVIDARPVPGTEKVIAILGSCHDRPWGALGIIDREKGMDGKSPVELTWPASAAELIGKGNYDMFKQVRPLYEDPYPLNDTYFLCSRTMGLGEQMGLFLIDVFGNEQLIYTEAPGCFDPLPLKSREKEYVIQEKRDYKSGAGTFYVQDVYQGTHMQGVERGAVKYLRVIESVEKRSWTIPAWNGQGVHRPAMNWHSFECKRILGTVPVEADGSAYVEVPADKYVYFQLLDENKMMIQSMRSGTMVQSGETLGCIGCHEDRRMAPPSSSVQVAQALQAPAQKLNGWYGEARSFGFVKEVQPVLDKHCAGCHDFGKKAGEKLILAGDRNPYFNAAYIDMYKQKVINPIGAGPAEIQPAYSWGAHSSKLIKKIQNGHAGVHLSEEEMERLVTWIDINAVYYPDFISAYPAYPAGRSPISQEELNRLGELTHIDFDAQGGHARPLRAQVTFERPELSPCLENIGNKKSAEYREALAIIMKGKNQLLTTPRLDMEGFVPSETDKKRLEKYTYRQEEEQKSRKAILEGEKHYDPELVGMKL
ncbi:HzsA-related protein [Maribellus maritimus]|uniref:HzsA-related protein n=1 Tax=Maribellus maritimus TaxID=2870838 RepID=UPI001EEB50FE|nr:hypothetical protein [Maribellus maritimus]MCG6191070.1 hypothetical protein [Maribellus maritimus]